MDGGATTPTAAGSGGVDGDGDGVGVAEVKGTPAAEPNANVDGGDSEEAAPARSFMSAVRKAVSSMFRHVTRREAGMQQAARGIQDKQRDTEASIQAEAQRAAAAIEARH